ncbi:MAG: hypothetical protein KatS3mg027_1614 [Bacteroidia bacterium]|nr:MAG: hypothetical protein KatS3mg027_1614 [Bacteroidia bacterium]
MKNPGLVEIRYSTTLSKSIFYFGNLLFIFAEKNNMNFKIFISGLILVSSFWGCKKSSEPVQLDTESQTAIDYSICEKEFSQVGPTATNLVIKTKSSPPRLMQGFSGILSTCDTLTWIAGDTLWTSPTHENPVYEYDFGTCGGYMFDGVPRSGKWRLTFRNGGIKKPGSSILIQLINYKLGTVSYSADSIVFKSGGTNNGVFTYTMNVYNAVCSAPSWTISYNSSRSVSVDTKNTNDPSDDVVTIVSGTANGKNRENRSFEVNITNLEKPTSCKYITKGTVSITPSGLKPRTINYGDGTCDNKATISVGGNVFEITLN